MVCASKVKAREKPNGSTVGHNLRPFFFFFYSECSGQLACTSTNPKGICKTLLAMCTMIGVRFCLRQVVLRTSDHSGTQRKPDQLSYTQGRRQKKILGWANCKKKKFCLG